MVDIHLAWKIDWISMNISPCLRTTILSFSIMMFVGSASAETVLDERYYPVPSGNRLQVGTEELRDNYSALAGLEGLFVDLSVVTSAGIDMGINVAPDLEDQVRAKIEAAGLKMLTEEEITAIPGLPMLNLWPSYDGADNDNIEVEYDENQCQIDPYCRTSLWAGYSESASILRRPEKFHRLSTWGSGDDTSSCVDRGAWMNQAVLDKVDLLISDYEKAQRESEILTVNQKSDVPSNCDQPWLMYLDIFATNQTRLNEQIKPILDELVSVSNSCAVTSYTIETHADTRADTEYNNILTVARAHSIKDYLISKGLPYSRVHTRPMGESQPLSTGSTEEDHALNRRVVIIPTSGPVLPVTAELEE